MRRFLAIALLAALSAQVAAQPVPPPAISAPAPVVARIEALADILDAPFSRFRTENHIPGLVYGIVAEGGLAYVQTFGNRVPEPYHTVTPDTLFRIASMSKAFTALAILKLRDEGRLRLDEPAETYVPEMRAWRYPTADSPRLRVRDLLSHAGGLVTDDPWGDRQQVLTERRIHPHSAGRRALHALSADQLRIFEFRLCPARSDRLATSRAAAIRIISAQEIMRPLGMESTGYDVFASPPGRARARLALGE